MSYYFVEKKICTADSCWSKYLTFKGLSKGMRGDVLQEGGTSTCLVLLAKWYIQNWFNNFFLILCFRLKTTILSPRLTTVQRGSILNLLCVVSEHDRAPGFETHFISNFKRNFEFLNFSQLSTIGRSVKT